MLCKCEHTDALHHMSAVMNEEARERLGSYVLDECEAADCDCQQFEAAPGIIQHDLL